jgi:hypothetical protein
MVELEGQGSHNIIKTTLMSMDFIDKTGFNSYLLFLKSAYATIGSPKQMLVFVRKV